MKKSLLLASAAVVAMGLGITSEAKAFDGVDWQWNKTVNVDENIAINVNDDFDLSGLVEIEKAQINIGDVKAHSYVNDINNNTPGLGEGGTVAIDETFVFGTVQYNDGPTDFDIIDPGPEQSQPGNPQLTGTLQGGMVDEQNDTIADLEVNVTGTVNIDALEGVNDAIDLPKIESIATAVANNQSIDSTAGLQLHDAQYNFGGFRLEEEPYTVTDPQTGEVSPNPEALGGAIALALSYFGADVTDNPHNDFAVGLTLAGALGVIEQGVVEAESIVGGGSYDKDVYTGGGIVNAFVDSQATAVGNNISANVDAAQNVGDAFMIADITQFNYADVMATSHVSNVDVNNYVGFGAAGMGPCGGCVEGAPTTPLVNSIATAVGNNVSISVSNANVGNVVGEVGQN